MKFASRILLISALAIAPVGCNRSSAPDQQVSANGPNDTYTEKTTPQQDRQTTQQNTQQTTRTTRPAGNRTETRTDTQTDQIRPSDRENRPLEVQRTRTVATVPSGTAITVTLADRVSTEANKEGDAFTAHLSQPIIVAGKVVAEKGDRVTGHIKTLEEPGRVKGRARLELVLDDIRTSKDTYKVSSEPFIVVASDNHERDAAEVAGGAAVGAAIGAIAGGKKGAAIGAVIGGGTGTTAVLITKGQELTLEPETKVNFVLLRDVDLPIIRTTNT